MPATGAAARTIAARPARRSSAPMRRDDALEHLVDEPLRVVEDLLHRPSWAVGLAGRRLVYSALTAAVSAARPSFASAKSIPVFGFV